LVKQLLFCRQLIVRPALLSAALRANSVAEFLADPAVANTDRRDLCIKVEQPSLQALRDACADFVRGDESDDEDEENTGTARFESAGDYIRHHFRYGNLKENMLFDVLGFLSRDTLSRADKMIEGLAVEPKEKMKITICGRSIWNYASQMKRCHR